MEKPQSAHEQSAKSKGQGPRAAAETAAESHSLIRLGQGFDQIEVLSEFRALGATVIRLW